MKLGEFQRGEHTMIVAWREFNGRTFLDLREHYKDATGTLRPTKRGATLRPNELYVARDMLDKAIALAEASR